MKNSKLILPDSYEAGLRRQADIKSDIKSGPAIAEKGKGTVKYATTFVSNQVPDYYNPLLQEASLMLPSKMREINQYCRAWYRMDPMVSAAVNFHSEFSINGFRNVCKDKKVKEYFDELAFDIIKLPSLLSFISLEWNKLGNVLPFGVWNESEGRWDRFITLNPDYVEIEKHLFSDKPILKLDPDEGLRRIVQNRSPKAIYDQLDPLIIQYVSKGQKIPLSDLEIEIKDEGIRQKTGEEELIFPQVCHLARKASMYEVYGTSPIMPAMKILIYKDLLRNAQMSIAKRHWKPIKLIKVGDEHHEPNDEILASLEEAIAAADSSSNAWLIWHHYISVDYIASAGKTMPLDGEYKYIDTELMRALEISDAVLTNQGMTFANASISLRVMVNKYLRFQKILSEFIREFIYKPVAQVQGFYETDENGKQKLIIPDIEWELMKLQDDAQLKSVLQGMQQKGLISKQTLMAYMNLDYEKERDLIKQEQTEEQQMGVVLPSVPGKGLGGETPPKPAEVPGGGITVPPITGKEPGAGTPVGTPPVTLPLV